MDRNLELNLSFNPEGEREQNTTPVIRQVLARAGHVQFVEDGHSEKKDR